MKKILVVLFVLLILVLTSMVGYKAVSANEKVDEIQDIILKQASKEKYYSSYGYTIDNPNVILDPYNVSPLTALILFETEKEEKVTIKIAEKDGSFIFQNTFDASKKHNIPVYGLYPNYSNKVIISYGNTKKEIMVKTSSLPDGLKVDNRVFPNKLTFVNNGKYPYAVDKNKEIRWYLTESYSGDINRLSNNHFLFDGNSLFSNELIEVDLFGKIYHQYTIDEKYLGSFVEYESDLFILADDLLRIDKQNGVLLKTIPLEKKYKSIIYNDNTNMLELSGNGGFNIKLDNYETAVSDNNNFIDKKYFISDFYMDSLEYSFAKGIKFSNLNKTVESDKNIFLVGYKDVDDNYFKYNIKIKKNSDYLRIAGKFSTSDKVYVVLDQFMDKRVYDLNNNSLIINRIGLNGRYSIYIKINDIIYKTDYYVVF